MEKNLPEFFNQINTLKDEKDAMQEKHTPVITIEGNPVVGRTMNVTINVGNGKHPNELNHNINWVQLSCCDIPYATATLTGGINDPVVTFAYTPHKKGECTMTARARCNLHGVWEGEIKFYVEG